MCEKGVLQYRSFVWKCTHMCKHRIGVQLLQNPPLCISTEIKCKPFADAEIGPSVSLAQYIRQYAHLTGTKVHRKKKVREFPVPWAGIMTS
jgi:hypothetical protein